jgi:hypothetical protein
MVRKILLFIMLSFSVAISGFWATRAQDPTPQQPATTTTTPQTTMSKTTQVDLSGTYAGTFNCAAAGLTGDTTLTINGNEFTTSDGKKGRIIASKSGGYTAVALQVATGDSTATSPVISFRGKKSGTKLTLSPVAGSTQQCSFTTSKNTGKGTPAATGTEVANPAATQSPTPSASPTPEASPTPSPETSPTPSESPRPSPTPAEPMPTPSPGASPTPSPTPTPRPA